MFMSIKWNKISKFWYSIIWKSRADISISIRIFWSFTSESKFEVALSFIVFFLHESVQVESLWRHVYTILAREAYSALAKVVFNGFPIFN